MNNHDQISIFASQIRSRLNKFRFLDGLIWSLLAVASILFIICCIYLIKGYAVPKTWFWSAGSVALIGATVVWLCRLLSKRDAARYADNFFDLKDSVGTALSFQEENREGEFVELQRQATADKIKSANPHDIKYNRPAKILGVLCTLLALCTMMAFKKASPHVVERQLLEIETEQRSAEAKETLKNIVEELEKELKEDGNEEIDINRLKEWVDRLEQTNDQKAALRQYAELERKLQDAAKKLDQRRNEQLLTKAGKEVQKDAENRSLGKKMEDKKFNEAAEDLKNLKPSPVGEKKMSEQRKKLARLKAATKRMSAASKAANRKSSSSENSENMAQKSQSKQNEANSGKPSESKSGEKMPPLKASNSNHSEDLDEKIAQLSKSLSEYEEALEDAELQEAQLGEIDPSKLDDLQNSEDAAFGDLDELAELMKKIGKKSDAKSKLQQLSKMAGKAQNFAQGQGKKGGFAQNPSPSSGKGGKKAGAGTEESRRNETDALVDNGQFSQLQGQKGIGPSKTTVEAAEDGSGVSNLRSNKKQQIEFSKQIESFVQREDVPDHVKEGVKTYFENIHQSNN